MAFMRANQCVGTACLPASGRSSGPQLASTLKYEFHWRYLLAPDCRISGATTSPTDTYLNCINLRNEIYFRILNERGAGMATHISIKEYDVPQRAEGVEVQLCEVARVCVWIAPLPFVLRRTPATLQAAWHVSANSMPPSRQRSPSHVHGVLRK
ncbi:hypothetical protein N657DRAFT_638893 [Parathielavia appendiculata]|uniref:Uncharacterized protein n=1 Tax=Parathielavia appendiculata TaxID=2587402 RepID=A0AAN6Z7B2_9PEZI|nr:hypothetical protein N657DRAFT_638893 [Parathielavia appendiculata]